MAVQAKTLLNDVGSAVLAETVSQINRAAGYTSVRFSTALVAFPPTPNEFLLCKFTEDVLVTAVEFGFGDIAARAFDNVLDSVGLFVDTTPSGVPLSGGPLVGALGFEVAAGAVSTFPTTDVWANMADLQAACDPANVTGSLPFQVAAGDSLSLVIMAMIGSQVLGQILESATVTYRPFKDALNLEPAFTPAMANFKSVTR